MRLLTVFLVIAVGLCAGKSVEGPRRAVVTFKGVDVQGKVLLEQASISSPVKIRGAIYGLEPGQHSIDIHQGSVLGERCESIGPQFAVEGENERPVAYLGNVKTFSGVPTRTDINIISQLISLFEEQPRSVLRRSLVIHALPHDHARSKMYVSSSEDVLACGVIEQSEVDYEEIFRPLERQTIRSNRFDQIEKSILDGEKPWENVRHPFYGRPEVEEAKIQSTVDGVHRPDLSADSLSLKSAVPTPKVWKAGKVYEYDYKGFIATGMFGLSPKTSGGSIEGRLVVEPVDESTVNVALMNTKAKMFNEDVLPELIEAHPGVESRIVDQEHLEKPIQIKIINGKIESVAIGKEEPLWIVNFKRALASQLQLQLDGTSGVFGDAAMAGYYADNTVYHAMEGCTTGECQTWYHISELSKEQLNAEPELLALPELCENLPVFEIIKNRDFDKCRVLPLYQYVSLQGLRCDAVNGAGCENKISHVDLVRVIGCRSAEGHFIVQRVKAMDKVVFKPFSYETEATEGKTIQHLTLKAIHSAGSLSLAKRIHSDVHLYQTLTYSYDEDYKTHGPLMGKPSLRKANSPMVMEVEKEIVIREAERLLSEIVADLESESFAFDPSSKFIPAKIDMLRRAIASLEHSELSAFVEKHLSAEQWSTKNQVVLDAVILSGTNPALMVVRDLILSRRVAGEQAVQAVSVLVGTVETPTKELLASFIDMLKSEVVTGHRQLKITSALFISKLVYQACVNSTMSLNMFPRLVMGEFCNAGDNSIVNQLVPWLTEQLHSATDAGERIAMLTALGNIGHEMILPSVLPFITSCEPSTAAEYEWIQRNHKDSALSQKELRQKWFQAKKEEQLNKWGRKVEDEQKPEWNAEEDKAACNLVRSKAIFALANLAAEKKQVVGSILMPIFFNKAEETEVRLAALSLLFVSNPPQAFWTRIAVSTWFEPNEQVAHYIYTTVASLVSNKDPMRREVAVRAESVLPLMKPMLWTSHSAINYVKAGYQEKARIGYITETVSFPGFESFIPSHHYNSMSVTLGPWFTKLIEYSVSGKQVEKFIDRLFGKPAVRSVPKAERDSVKITSPELNKIHEELKIEARATGQPELYIYLNFLDNYQRFFTLNPASIVDTVEKLVLKKGFASTNGQASVNYHKYVPVLDSMIRIPSSMGLAYSIIGHHSIFVSIKSEIRGGLDMPNMAAKLEGEIKPAIVAKMSHRLMVETPFTRAYPFTGVEFQTAAAMPGKFSLIGDLKTSKVATSFELMGDKLRLLKYSVTPFTSIRKIEDFTPAVLLKDTKIITLLEEPKEVKQTFGRSLGLNVQYIERGDIHSLKTPLLYSKDWFGTLAFYALPSTLRHRELNIFVDVANSESKALKTYVSFVAKTPETLKSNVDQPDNLFTKSLYNTLFGQTIKSQEQYVKEHNEEWTAHKLNRVFKTLSNPLGYSLDISAELVGKSDAKIHRMGASIAYGIGDAGKTHRATVMMQKVSESETEGNFVVCTEYEASLPEKSAVKRDLLSQAERTDIVKIAFGKSCTDDRKVTVTSKVVRGEEEIPSTIRSKWEQERCDKQELIGQSISKECQTTRRLASILNKAVVTIDYNEMPAIVRNATVKFNNIFRHFMAPYMSDNQVEVRNTENQVRIESVYYPIIGSMDVRVFKPKSNTFFTAIDVHPVAEVLLPARLAVPRDVLAAPGVCLIERETITTFDGLSYTAPISSCDQVITKDCSGRYNLAVLARRESASKKVFTILLDAEKIEIDAAERRVTINGQSASVADAVTVKSAENKIVAVIRRTADNWIEVESPSHMIRVTVNENEIMIAGSPIHRGRLCGLCGSATGNKITDLTGPRQCSLPRELMSVAYEVQRPAGCKSVKTPELQQQLQRVQNKCIQEKKSSIYGITNAQPLLPRFQQTIYSSHVTRSASQYVQYRNKMVVRDEKRCFSTISVPKCVEGAKPTAMVEQQVPFHCMANNFLAEKLSEEIQSRPLDELNGKEISLIQSVSVPRACALVQ